MSVSTRLKLGVNIDHVATLRQARGGEAPDPLEAARICRSAGAHSVVMHLREDRRHIQDFDLFRVKQRVPIRLNLEMAVASSVVKVAKELVPDQVTLVPEKREERTTESGLELIKNATRLSGPIEAFKKKNITVSLFIDPDEKQIRQAVKLAADAVEFHTGTYANARTRAGVKRELERLKEGVGLACSLGLAAHAGHGLDYENVLRIKHIPGLRELNIGYSIVTRALWVGFEAAVKEMLELLK